MPRQSNNKPKSKMTEAQEVEVKEWGQGDVAYLPNEVPTVYTNNARISFNNFDGSILFGEIVGDKDGKLVVAPRVKVTMSLPFVKALQDLLNRNVDLFEKKFGEITQFDLEES